MSNESQEEPHQMLDAYDVIGKNQFGAPKLDKEKRLLDHFFANNRGEYKTKTIPSWALTMSTCPLATPPKHLAISYQGNTTRYTHYHIPDLVTGKENTLDELRLSARHVEVFLYSSVNPHTPWQDMTKEVGTNSAVVQFYDNIATRVKKEVEYDPESIEIRANDSDSTLLLSVNEERGSQENLIDITNAALRIARKSFERRVRIIKKPKRI